MSSGYVVDKGLVRWIVETIAGSDGTFPGWRLDEVLTRGPFPRNEMDVSSRLVTSFRSDGKKVFDKIVEEAARNGSWGALDWRAARLAAGKAVLEAIDHWFAGVEAKEPPLRNPPLGMAAKKGP